MIQFGKREDYYASMGDRELFEAHDCPFCSREKFQDMIIWEGTYWIILYNKYPYTGNDQHIMAIPCAHKEFFIEFTEEEVAELKQVHEEVKKFF